MEEKIIFESCDELLICQVTALLEDNDITYIRKDLGCGSYLNILMGQSFSKKQILVSEKDYGKAIELLEVFNNAEYELPDELKNSEE